MSDINEKRNGVLRVVMIAALLALLPTLTPSFGQGKKPAGALAPTKVHLKFDNTPIDQAVAELSRKIGYFIFLDDIDGKLKNRTITLDTGEVTFWEAVEKVCAEAKLVEGLPALALAPKELPKLPPLPKPGEKIPLIKIGDGTPIFRTIRGVMTLKDGKPLDLPTDTATAVRIKPSRLFVPASTPGEVTCGLKVSPEPKLRWNETLGIRIDKAVDDNGQVLQQIKKTNVPKFGGSFGGGTPGPLENDNVAQVAVRLSKGAKETKMLKELRGVISASVSVFGSEVLTVNDIVKSQGKLIKGAKGGSIKVGPAKVDDQGEVQLSLEMNLPAAFLPVAKIGGGYSATPFAGLKVLDAAGKAIPIVSMSPISPNPGPGVNVEYLVKARPAPDQTLTKVSYAVRQNVTMDVPFSLKDVAVP